MTRDGIFWIKKVEELYYPRSENKGADQLRSCCEADVRLCFRLGKIPVFLRRGSLLKQVDTSSSVKTGLKRVILIPLYPQMHLYLLIQNLKIWFDALRPWEKNEVMSVVYIYHIIYGKAI